MLKTFIWILATIFTVSHAYASEPPAWLYKAIKVKNPNELSYFVEISNDCPLTRDAANKIVGGVLIRSRIKPLKEDIFVNNRVYLSVRIVCIKLTEPATSSLVFSVDASFARYKPKPAVLFDYQFGFHGIGPKDYIEQNVKSSTERAITAFIKSNFNL